MNRTKIEWVKNPDGSEGYTWNPITGCLNHTNGLCKGGGFPCYAYKLANGRLKNHYLKAHTLPKDKGILADSYPTRDPFYPRFWEEKLSQPIGYATTEQLDGILAAKPPKGKGIFVCDMSDLFGIGVPEEWTRKVLRVIEHTSYNRYYLLTKQPQRLPEFSPFPENCWVGVTATNTDMLMNAINCLESVRAKVKYISFEPLLSWADTSKWVYPLTDSLEGLNWLIIGACTGTLEDIKQALYANKDTDGLVPMLWGNRWTLQPKIEWLREIVGAANRAGIPVFLKDNLRPLLIPEDCSKPNYLTEDIFWASEKAQLRQELPK
jgi:protein gp37